MSSNKIKKMPVSTIIKLSTGEEVKTSFSKRSIEKYLAMKTTMLFVNHIYFKTEEIVELIPVFDEDFIEVEYGEMMFPANEIIKIRPFPHLAA